MFFFLRIIRCSFSLNWTLKMIRGLQIPLVYSRMWHALDLLGFCTRIKMFAFFPRENFSFSVDVSFEIFSIFQLFASFYEIKIDNFYKCSYFVEKNCSQSIYTYAVVWKFLIIFKVWSIEVIKNVSRYALFVDRDELLNFRECILKNFEPKRPER